MGEADPKMMDLGSSSKMNSSGMPSTTDHHEPDTTNHTTDYGKTSTTNNLNIQTNNNTDADSNLRRQSSIYSLTLDEFQHTLCENGKNFGSMNMDEFLSSIWTAEENQAQAQAQAHHADSIPNSSHKSPPLTSEGIMVAANQPSLPRQGSLTLPAPLCRKTVDEVWSEIHRAHQHDHQNQNQNQPAASSSNPTSERQATFGEMTLEDFLVKAGVVREQCGPAPPQQHHSFGFTGPHPSFGTRPIMGGEASGFVGNGKRNNGYPSVTLACYGGVSQGGGYGTGLSPVSPVSPEGICGPGQVDNTAAQYGLDLAGLRGRKRVIDGPVEKVVERRQRRMIKNRESAARSRARKQAYTVELEAELNQLREENTQLKHALAEAERRRKQKQMEQQQKQVPRTKAERAFHKLKTAMRSRSCTL